LVDCIDRVLSDGIEPQLRGGGVLRGECQRGAKLGDLLPKRIGIGAQRSRIALGDNPALPAAPQFDPECKRGRGHADAGEARPRDSAALGDGAGEGEQAHAARSLSIFSTSALISDASSSTSER
jgi:hypothetical protein